MTIYKGLSHLAQNKNTRKESLSEIPLYYRKSDSKAVFLGRNSCEFRFYVCFLAALPALDVLLYAYRAEITTSASE